MHRGQGAEKCFEKMHRGQWAEMCLGKVHRGQGAESASRGWNNVGLCGRNLVPFFSFGDHAGFITENIVPFLSENAQKRFWAPPPYQLSEHAVIGINYVFKILISFSEL